MKRAPRRRPTRGARCQDEVGGFIDAAPSPELASWARTAARTSDAYLVQLAKTNNARLATFDRGLVDPAAELIG